MAVGALRPWYLRGETVWTTFGEPANTSNQPPSPPPRRRTAPSSPLGLWDRFSIVRTMQQIMETLDRIIEDPFAYSTSSLPSLSGDDSMGSSRRTPWEIKEGEMEYKIWLDMPGMTKKDVKVWVEDRMLVIKAEKLYKKGKEQEEVEEEEEGWSAMSYRRYNSRIALPDNVMVEKIKAEVKDCMLYITIPKISPSSKALYINV